MNTPLIEIDPAKVATLADQYERAIREHPERCTETDKKIAKAFRAATRGTRLVDVDIAITAAGVNVAGLPKLALTRAHAARVFYVPREQRIGQHWCSGRLSSGEIAFVWNRTARKLSAGRNGWVVVNPPETFVKKDRPFSAHVPYIPAWAKPKHRLENYFILFEANWHPEPPRDPYLLRPVVGSIMEILAEWDLTDIEIAAVRAGAR
jgi:hypothetical protein